MSGSSPLDAPIPAGRSAEVDWTHALGVHARWLRTVVIARLGQAQGADEVLQEVALAAVSERAPLKDAAKVGPWLYRLAVVQSLLYRRRRGRERKRRQQWAERQGSRQVAGSADGNPLVWLLAEERRQLVREALGGLHPRDAEMLLLKYTEDWSYHQLAEHLGISHSAVESRLHRARQRLRESLTQLEAAPLEP